MSTGPTKAELIQQVNDLRTQRDAALVQKPDDVEAEAIARCVKALKPLASGTRNYSTMAWQEEQQPLSVRRVLHYLARRHGFTLHDEVQPVVTVCPACEERGHL